MKRTLVIANACFSDQGSNGRTLANLFLGAETDKLAQFYVYGSPDFGVCRNYYKISDSDALLSLIPGKNHDGRVYETDFEQHNEEGPETNACVKEPKPCREEKTVKKNPIKVLGRELIWKFGRWENHCLWNWIEEFQPEIICLFIANTAFLPRLAIRVARKKGIPILLYTTEAYNFMDFNYFTNKPSLAYQLYYAWLKHSYKKISPFVKGAYFNNTLLRDDYHREYGYPCYCIMNSSSITFSDHSELIDPRNPKIAYMGNLGLGRHEALMEIARVLNEIEPHLKLDVYGPAPNSKVVQDLNNCKGLQYHGLVSYEKVVEITKESDLVVHVEKNDPIVNRDLKYAFSTKIADCVCSGTPLLLYANENLAETIFIQNNKCAFVVNKSEKLHEALEEALFSVEKRKEIIANAKVTSREYLTGNKLFLEALS